MAQPRFYSVRYIYNDIDLISEIWYTDNGSFPMLAYKYEYTASGQVYRYTDYLNGEDYELARSTVYKYDTNGRMVGFIEYENTNPIYSITTVDLLRM